MSAAPQDDVHPLKRLLRYAASHRGRLRIAASWSVLNKLFDLAPPFLIGMAVDVVVEREDSVLAGFGVADPLHQLVVLAVLTLVIWICESVFEYLHGVVWRGLAQTIQHELRLDTFKHVQRLDMTHFEGRAAGSFMATLNDDVNQLERFLDTGANDLIQLATTAIAISAAFIALSPWVGVVSLIPLPFVILGSLKFHRLIAPRYVTVRDQASDLNSHLGAAVGGMATIKSFAAEPIETERIRQESLRYGDANRAAIKLSSAFSPLIRMVIVVGFIAAMLLGGWLTLEGQLAVGAYSVMVFLTQRLLWPFTRLGQVLDLYQRAMASTGRILDLLDTPVEIVDGERTIEPDAVRGDIRFEHLTFAYHPGQPILRDIDLDIPAGRTTAIVGATGSGKSTLIKLLLRFYEPHEFDEGRILVDDIDIRKLTLADLRRSIALVSQDIFLFNGSVRDNIAYGRAADRAQDEDGPGRLDALNDVPMDDIIAAARTAEAHDFIENLRDGYDTVVGERGQRLSGGQRQRIAMARAILKDAPILVLDEATSSVDNETEAAIQRSLAKITVNRTTLVIAHRLSTIRHAHAIHVLADGRITESGTHEELLERGGLYASLWAVQTGEGATQETGHV